MSHYIKGLVIRFLKNLKKTWFLGVILLLCAIAFVILTSKDTGEDLIGGEPSTTIGVQTVAKLEWNFDDEVGAAYEAKAQNAIDSLNTLYRYVSTGNFYNAVSSRLEAAGLDAMTGADYFSVAIASYNIVETVVVGTDADRVEAVEKAIREEMERFMTDGYQIRSWNVISEPVMLVAVPGGAGYVLTNQLYVETPELEENNDAVVEGTENSLLTLSNIVIVISSVMLWCAIVVLLTIADGRIYSVDELKKLDIICYGEAGADEEANRALSSLVNKKVENEKIASFHTLILDRKDVMPAFVQKYKDMYDKNLEVSNWKKDAVDKIKKQETVLLAIKRGEFSLEELEECLKMLNVVEIKCIGCILY